MPEPISKNDQEAMDCILKMPKVALLGIGIPGLIGTGMSFELKDVLIRDEFTFWIFWMTEAAWVLSTLLAGSVCKPGNINGMPYDYSSCAGSSSWPA